MNDPIQEGEIRPLSVSAPENRAELPKYDTPAPAKIKPAPSAAWVAAALLSYIPAFIYIKAQFSGYSVSRIATPLFALLLLAGVELFCRAEHRAGNREAPFWAACWLALSIAFSLFGYQSDPLSLWQFCAWHLFAIWYILARTGILAAGKSGSLFFLDGIAGVFLLPWPNFLARITTVFRGLAARRRAAKKVKGGTALIAVFSVLAAVAVCLVAWGELSAVDAHFAAIGGDFREWLDRTLWNNQFFVNNLVYFLLSLPVGAWLFGLVAGCLRRSAPPVSAARFYGAISPLRRLPGLTVYLVVGALCAVYALFFGLQTLEFFSAMGRTVGTLTAPDAAAFAVDGFWELCRIMLLNFAVLAAIYFFGTVPLRESKAQKALAALFCLFGIAFAGLAIAKLLTYIRLYGYTPRRVASGWFLCVLAVWAVLAFVWVFKAIPAARIGVLTLALSFTLLCCADPNARIVEGNLARYTSGQDAAPDVNVLSQCGVTYGPRAGAQTQRLIDSGWFNGRTAADISDLYYGISSDPGYVVNGAAELPLYQSGSKLVLTFRQKVCVSAAVQKQ